METRVGAQTPYEVYCYSCKVTFPIGTRQCIHCGRPIGGSPLTRARHPADHARRRRSSRGDRDAGQISMRKLGGMSIWVLLALAAAVSRLCAGQ